MFEIIFLSALALVWIIFAVIQDLRSHEVSNWLNFSLITFALGFRLFYSVFAANNLAFFYQGLIGLGIFLILGNAFYYGKLFAGGDAKLMIALGAVLPLTSNFMSNVKIFVFFILIFFFAGAIYTIVTSAALGIKSGKKLPKEFQKQLSENKKRVVFILMFAIIFAIAGVTINPMLLYLAGVIFVMPYIYIYAKAVDEICMIKSVSPRDLREGDWLYESVKVGRKTINADWGGLTKKDISRLQRAKKKVRVRKGIPFTPVFLISFILVIVMLNWVLAWSLI